MIRAALARGGLYLSVLGLMLRRHADTFRQAWALRRQIEGEPYRGDEAEFHASALSLQRSPPSPAPRIAAWLLIGFAILALAWALVGQVDIVATAQGKIAPSGRSKPIQSMETASVAAIHVRDGDTVRAGQLLLQLDATGPTADVDRLRNEWLAAQLQALRARSMLAALESGQPPVLVPEANIPPLRLREATLQAEAQFIEYRTTLDRLDADIERRKAELRSVGTLVAKLEQTLPIVRSRAQDYRDLNERNFVSRHAWLEKEQLRLEQEGELAAQVSRLAEIRAALRESEEQRRTLVAGARRQALDAAADGQQKAESLWQELLKAEARRRLMDIAAPIDGTVQQLAVNTVGAVVTPAQALLLLVPSGQPLEVDAVLENKDIGFVRAGQPVEVKIETFPYTRYGTIRGTVEQVSRDAINDDKGGLSYLAKIRLEHSSIRVNDGTVALHPGMAVVAEVKTGQRRVIEYFLSPLVEHATESLRER